MRARKGFGVEEDGDEVDLLVELFSMYDSGELMGAAPLSAFRGTEGWRV